LIKEKPFHIVSLPVAKQIRPWLPQIPENGLNGSIRRNLLRFLEVERAHQAAEAKKNYKTALMKKPM